MAEKPLDLEELLKDTPPEKLVQPCLDHHLCEIARYIGDWEVFAPLLGLREPDIGEIKGKNLSPTVQRLGMLKTWKSKFGRNATYRELAMVFRKFYRNDLVEKVCEVLSSSSFSEKVSLDSYSKYLKGKYTKRPDFLTVQRPPPPTRKFIDVAMIQHQTHQCAVDEEHVQAIMHGKVDRILENNKTVKLENIFELDEGERKIIVIEGAPGAGKSTLAWHIVQKWKSGELFQEFKVLIFVHLQDPAIRSATSLTDILPVDTTLLTNKEVMSMLESCGGSGILFVLDGWDEVALQADSVFQKLVCSPDDIGMYSSSLIVTSRPIASRELQQHSSSRVEIVGFTSAAVKTYFRESIFNTLKMKKLQDHLRERPVIEDICYLPLNAAIVVHLFHNNDLNHPLHMVLQSLICCCIIRHLHGRQFPDISSLNDLPQDIQEPFNTLCTMAFHGVMKNKVTFSAADLQSFNLPTEVSTLSLIQGVQTFTTFGKSVSYNFPHHLVQELLAAFHISKSPPAEQIKVFNDLLEQPRLATVFRFYAAFTRLQTEGVRDIVARIVQKREKPLLINLLHGLHEAQDPSLCQFVASLLNGELDLQGNQLSPMDCLVVGYFLSCVCIRTLDICDCDIGDLGVMSLASALEKNDSLSELILSGNESITGTGLLSLGESLKRNRGLMMLVLLGLPKITNNDLKQFMACLCDNDHVTKLVLPFSTRGLRQERGRVNHIRAQKGLPLLEMSHKEIADQNRSQSCYGLLYPVIVGILAVLLALYYLLYHTQS